MKPSPDNLKNSIYYYTQRNTLNGSKSYTILPHQDICVVADSKFVCIVVEITSITRYTHLKRYFHNELCQNVMVYCKKRMSVFVHFSNVMFLGFPLHLFYLTL